MNDKDGKNNRTEAELAEALQNIRLILINTSHPGNIGSAARAMKVMGLTELHLVTPKTFPSSQATAMASGAHDLLDRAVVHDSLDSALSGCQLVLGTSARLRSLSMPQVTARRGAERAVVEAQTGTIAVLFGREQWGLTNEEMQRCHYLVHIPSNPEYSSLNLAQAVQVLAYEFRAAALADISAELPALDWAPVADDEMQRFYRHLEQTLAEIRFLHPSQPKRLMMRLRRLFNRARPDQNEMNILRGWLSATQRAAQSEADDAPD